MVAKLGLWWKNLLKKWSKYKTINWAYHDSRLQTSYFNGPIPASFINFSLYYKKLTVSSIKVAYDWIRTEVLSQPMPNMPTSYPVFVDVVDGPRGSHLLILTLPLAWCAIAVTLVWQEVPKTVKWSLRIIILKPVLIFLEIKFFHILPILLCLQWEKATQMEGEILSLQCDKSGRKYYYEYT